MKYFVYSALLLISCRISAQDSVQLSSLAQFIQASDTWKEAGRVWAHFDSTNQLQIFPGTGIIVNAPASRQAGVDIISVVHHGDAEISADFLLAKGARSGIYLQGRYEVQLNDRWGNNGNAAGSHGGIYVRRDFADSAQSISLNGHSPRQDVYKPPGVWQKINIQFRAPRFDGSGRKLENAKIIRLFLNGVLIQENLELTGTSTGAAGAEAAEGPLRIRGDGGGIAFRNFVLKNIREESVLIDKFSDGGADPIDPILVESPKNTILRSFMDIPGERIVRAVSVGSPQGVHFTYDMANGALVQAWRGGFLDATPMWHERGDGSSKPVGAVVPFGKPVPAVAKKIAISEPWLADTSGTGFRMKGYKLDKTGRPVFSYAVGGAAITDSITVLQDGRGLQRHITIHSETTGFYVRLASGKSIENAGGGLFLVDDQKYYVKIDESPGGTAVIQDREKNQELLVPVSRKIVYSILF